MKAISDFIKKFVDLVSAGIDAASKAECVAYYQANTKPAKNGRNKTENVHRLLNAIVLIFLIFCLACSLACLASSLSVN